MKVLCPTDFSKASIQACRWVSQFLNDQKKASLEILHCINLVSRAAIFVKVDDIFTELAEKDIAALKAELQQLAPNLTIRTKVVRLNPKSFTTEYAEREQFDLIVTGTKGLTNLKEVTVGSVTAYLMDHASVPILVIPENTSYRGVHRIILGIDDDGESTYTLAPLIRLVDATRAQLEVVHTMQMETIPMEDAPPDPLSLPGLRYTFSNIPQGKSIPETLTQYSIDRQADLMVLVHRQRNFLERVLLGSYAHEELFIIKTPLLILPQED